MRIEKKKKGFIADLDAGLSVGIVVGAAAIVFSGIAAVALKVRKDRRRAADHQQNQQQVKNLGGGDDVGDGVDLEAADEELPPPSLSGKE